MLKTSHVDNRRFPSSLHATVVVSVDCVNLTCFCVSLPLLFVIFLFVYILAFELRVDNFQYEGLSLIAD